MATAVGTQLRKNGFYFAFIVLCILANHSFCQAEDTSNLNESDPNIQMAPALAGSNQSPVTNFDPNAYHFLIYNPRGSEANITNGAGLIRNVILIPEIMLHLLTCKTMIF